MRNDRARERIEVVVGQRVRLAREDLRLSQQELGNRIGEVLGRPWSRQQVSDGERGSRDWRIGDLVAVATALNLHLGWFVVPPDPETEVELSKGSRGFTTAELQERFLTPSQRNRLDAGAQIHKILGEVMPRLASVDEMAKLISSELYDTKTGKVTGRVEQENP